MLSVLYRTLVLPFYARNAGTFLVIVLLAFGFMRPMDHEALITAALGSPFLLAVIFGLWSFYTGRIARFVHGQLAAPEHRFLQTYRLVPPRTRYTMWLLLVTQLLLPIIGYAGWMGARAVHYQAWGPLSGIVGAVLGQTAAGTWAADYRLRHPNPAALRLPRLNIRLPYELFFSTYWLRHHPLAVGLTKLISAGLLVGVCRLYPTDDYDERLLVIGLLLAIITHSGLARQVDAFEHRYLLMLNNMPLSRLRRLGRYALTYGLVWLPELVLLLRNCPAAVPYHYAGLLWLTGWGWLLLLHSLAYGRNVAPDRWQTAVFWGFIGGLLLIMYHIPVGAWLAVGWLGAAGVSFFWGQPPRSVSPRWW